VHCGIGRIRVSGIMHANQRGTLPGKGEGNRPADPA